MLWFCVMRKNAADADEGYEMIDARRQFRNSFPIEPEGYIKSKSVLARIDASSSSKNFITLPL